LASVPASKRHARVGALVKYLADAVLGEKQLPVLMGLQDALANRREYPEPAAWKELYPDLANSDTPELRSRAEALAVLFGNQKAITDLKLRISDKSAPTAARLSAIELLTRRKADGLVPELHAGLADPTIRGAAIRALAAFPDDTTPSKLLAVYPMLTASEKADAVQTLVSRPAFASALLDAIEKGTVARADVSVVAARQVLALNDKALAAKLAKVWGTIRPAAQDRTAAIKRWKGLLGNDLVKVADRSKGRALFVQHCSACHKLFGEGGDTAPDLTGSQRANLDYVLENVLDPNSVVPREFQVTNVTLTDGRLVSGVILRETPDGVTVRTVNDTVVVPKGDVETRKQTSQSLMPEGLFDKMTPEEVRDLVAYLASPQQVALPVKQ
jgi:putative heme-binding domain-containing protein